MDHCENHKSIQQSKNFQKKKKNHKKVGEKNKNHYSSAYKASSSTTKETSCISIATEALMRGVHQYMALFSIRIS